MSRLAPKISSLFACCRLVRHFRKEVTCAIKAEARYGMNWEEVALTKQAAWRPLHWLLFSLLLPLGSLNGWHCLTSNKFTRHPLCQQPDRTSQWGGQVQGVEWNGQVPGNMSAIVGVTGHAGGKGVGSAIEYCGERVREGGRTESTACCSEDDTDGISLSSRLPWHRPSCGLAVMNNLAWR